MLLDSDGLAKGESGCCLLGLLAIGLAQLRAVDAVQADAFGVVVVQDFDSVAVDYTNDFPFEVRSDKRMDENKSNGQERSNEEIVTFHMDCLVRRDCKVG